MNLATVDKLLHHFVVVTDEAQCTALAALYKRAYSEVSSLAWCEEQRIPCPA